MKWNFFKRNKNRPRWKDWLYAFLQAAVLILIFRNFIFTMYVVRSDSMQPQVQPGDWVAVNLLAYGPRFPSTLVCVPFTSVYLKSAELPVVRIPGYCSPQRNDLVLFNYPDNHGEAVERKPVYIKRLVGLPGDTVALSNNGVKINGKQIKQPPSVNMQWIIRTRNTRGIKAWAKKMRMKDIIEMVPGEWLVNMNTWQTKMAKQQFGANAVEFAETADHEILETLFTGKLKGYNLSHFAATWIPRAGKKIQLNAVNMQLYGHCIRLDGHSASFKNGKYFIDGVKAQSYTFAQDYYFVLGDARASSVDSRYWGFVPRSHLLGKASFIVFSLRNEPGRSGVRWNRCFKNID